ncbi:hypothetical protein [Microbacterium elymi]|uniref:Sensor histidine kinase n=1 Tax=Microbacterium elymi TaxID=2909587 RepID=A0ABY5NJB8_9MICO|nr:hypothetical protein [Microbacterium elymi]UUT35221.1 hypothetical protein L2X98_33955 [Microbacterium elymi]
MAFGGFGDTAGGRDRSFERAAALNQLLLGLVVLVITVMLVASPAASGMPLFFAGIVLVFIATGAAVIVPWNRINAWWLTAVPVADILAITLMRLADPRSGIGLLWVFPAIWLSSTFGLVGAVGGSATILAAFAVTVIGPTGLPSGYSALPLPLVIVIVSGTSYATARRSAAQRMPAGQAGAGAGDRPGPLATAGAGGRRADRCGRLRPDPDRAGRRGLDCERGARTAASARSCRGPVTADRRSSGPTARRRWPTTRCRSSGRCGGRRSTPRCCGSANRGRTASRWRSRSGG